MLATGERIIVRPPMLSAAMNNQRGDNRAPSLDSL
jgi:hypothetical protein